MEGLSTSVDIRSSIKGVVVRELNGQLLSPLELNPLYIYLFHFSKPC